MYFYFTVFLPRLINVMYNLMLFVMETKKLNPIENDYSKRTSDFATENVMLLLPNEEITFKIKVNQITTLRMWFEKVEIGLAQKENVFEV